MEDHPELKQTFNTKGQDVPLLQALSQEEYLTLSKKYFEETGKHLDEKGWAWVSTKSGPHLVNSDWYDGERCVNAVGLSYQFVDLGFRSSRSYFS